MGSYVAKTRKNTFQVINELLRDTPSKQSIISKVTPRDVSEASRMSPFRVSEELAEMEQAQLKLMPKPSQEIDLD